MTAYFSRERFVAFQAEEAALYQAAEEAARDFEALTRDPVRNLPAWPYDVPARDRQPVISAGLLALIADNRIYAVDHGRCEIYNDTAVWDESRFGDHFQLPLEFLHDPDTWTARFNEQITQETAARQEADKRSRRRAKAQRERRDRAEYERLRALYDTPDNNTKENPPT